MESGKRWRWSILPAPPASLMFGSDWLPRWCSSEEPTCQCRRHKRCGFDPWVRKIPWKRKRQPTPVFLPGKSPRQRSLARYSPWGSKELDTSKHTHRHVFLDVKPQLPSDNLLQLSDIWTSSLENDYLVTLPIFQIDFSYWVVWDLYIFWILTPIHCMIYKVFLPFCRLPFHFAVVLVLVFLHTKLFSLM